MSRPSSRPQREQGRGALGTLLETVALIAFAIVLAALLKAFVVQAFYVPSISMEPTFVRSDRILVEKPSQWDGEGPGRGDIVVFQDPGGWLGGEPALSRPQQVLQAIGLLPAGGHLVKRVVGVGGDTVACCGPGGGLLLNGEEVEEAYLPDGVKASEQEFSVTVPDGKLWMMGDNRSNSEDSRAHREDPGGGFVDQDLVVGKVFVLVWPFDRWRWFGF